VNAWLIEPRDPLIARDGRPAAIPRFSTVAFPYPSMLAGAVRTRMASGTGSFDLTGTALDELKKIPVHGPLLAELDAATDEVLQWLAPAPLDALILESPAKRLDLKRLAPRKIPTGCRMDQLDKTGLLPVTFTGDLQAMGKPPRHLPAFWRWEDFESWLKTPQDCEGVDTAALGLPPLPVEVRAHVSIRPGERVGIEGALFQTSGLRFLQPGDSPLSPRRLALSIRSAGGEVSGSRLSLHQQMAPLGGERRLAQWRPSTEPWPAIPPEVREAISKTGRARIVLLTPAAFAQGSLPGWSRGNGPLSGPVQVKVRAACVSRPEIVSGWDLAADNGDGKPKGRPKPTKRLAGAGSVYFVELEGGTEKDRAHWCDQTWLACLSDREEQDRLDGFGLAVLGTWEEMR
jgi:CRISPR-associated protein Cmr3